MDQAYLDNAATTPLHPNVIAAMTTAFSQYGNPSSLHDLGILAEKKMKQARDQLAGLLKVSSSNIVFTSSGTEANNLALKGALARTRRRGRLVTSSIEHPSVLAVFKELESQGWEVLRLPVDAQGQVRLSALKEAFAQPVQLVSLIAVNNETGVIQLLAEIVRLIRACQPDVIIHTDAVQAVGKMPFYPAQLGVNSASISSHKIFGPKGMGALYVDKRATLSPLIHGGGQEQGLRSGTENIPGIIGFGQAAIEVAGHLRASNEKVSLLRQQFIEGLASLPCQVISPPAGVPHILAVSFPGFKGEVLLHALSARGIYVSTGAACSGKKGQFSYVAQALGLDTETGEGLLRFSFSPFNTEREIDYTLHSLQEIVAELAFVRGRRGQ